MYKIKLFTFLIFIMSTYLQAQSLVAWNKDVKLNYTDFKKSPTQKKKPQGVLDSRLGWQIAEADGQIPQLKVFNRYDQSNSWISMKHEGILKEMQLQFDLSELYARKIRKDFSDLQAKKAMSKDTYRTKFEYGTRSFQKRLSSLAGVTLNQPDLYKLINKQIQDSLVLYSKYQY
jgi:hypothetical protein